MRILVLWRRERTKTRSTIIDHAFSLMKYDKENEYFYFDILNGRFEKDYAWITDDMFDAVVFHYSVSLRYFDKYWDNFYALMVKVWKDKKCKKIMIIQDDYSMTKRSWDLINGINADAIFTIIREWDIPKVYPEEKIGKRYIKNVLTGYVEEKYIDSIPLKKHKDREYDLIYRARKLPYEFGKLGQLKYELATVFQEKMRHTDLVTNLANTDGNKEVFYGDAWLMFTADSRVALGCLGGSGLIDYDGSVRDRYAKYVEKNPSATYEEAKKVCFPHLEENLTGMLSPRIFECAITKTCQVLVGDDYHGILRPDIDYLMLKNDFSNIDSIIEKIRDIDYCEKIANTCYERVVSSHEYTYEKYVNTITSWMKQKIKPMEKSEKISKLIAYHCKKNNDEVWLQMQELERKYG